MAHSKPEQASQQQPQKKTVAMTLLRRHVNHRQRFDSADYAMGAQFHQQQRDQKYHDVTAPGGVTSQEPEPEVTPDNKLTRSGLSLPDAHSYHDDQGREQYQYPQQQVRRIRLQRFDSADWAMQMQGQQHPGTFECNGEEGKISTYSDAMSGSPGGAVAKLLLERHAYKTCHFVRSPVKHAQRCAEKA